MATLKAAKKAKASFNTVKKCRTSLPLLTKTVVCNDCNDTFSSVAEVKVGRGV